MSRRIYNDNGTLRVSEARRETIRVHQDRHNLNATLRKLNVTMDDYLHQLVAQNGLCAICADDPPVRLCIDHDHSDDHFRGLLCHRCNRVLGAAEDSIELLQAAILYLQTH